MDIRQQWPVRWETHEVSTTIIPAHYLQEFLVCDADRKVQAESSKLPKLRRQMESNGSKVIRLCKTEYWRGESYTERKPQGSADTLS